MRIKKGDRIRLRDGNEATVSEDQDEVLIFYFRDGDDPSRLDFGRRGACRDEVTRAVTTKPD